MKLLLMRAGVFALLFLFCTFVVSTMVAIYRNVDDDKPTFINESIMVPTADGRTIECIVFSTGAVSCNWNPPTVAP